MKKEPAAKFLRRLAALKEIGTPGPAARGFRFPAEWEPQEAVWLSWPHNLKTWPGHFRPIPAKFAEIVAHISHLPQVLASTLCAFLAQKNPAWRNYSGGGLRDTTRIAGSSPEMWRDISLANRDALLIEIDDFADRLAKVRAMIAASRRSTPRSPTAGRTSCTS